MKPTMTLRYGASHNSLTINDGGVITTIDFNSLTREHRQRVGRMAVDAWEKIRAPKRTKRRARKRA